MILDDLDINWIDEFNGAITVCDREGIIVYMNDFSIRQFEKRGGEKLLGTNLLDCHSETSKTKLKNMLENHTENMYVVEKEGNKKIILQTPWKEKGIFKGVVEISFFLKPNMSFFDRE